MLLSYCLLHDDTAQIEALEVHLRLIYTYPSLSRERDRETESGDSDVTVTNK